MVKTLQAKRLANQLATDLRTLLTQGESSSQEALCHALSNLGYVVNQSKVSRLLRKFGAVKAKNEFGKIVYRLPKEPAPPTKQNHIFQTIVDIRSNENIILVQTTPGAAAVVARILDYNRDQCKLLGTIAGDDNILVIPLSIEGIHYTLVKLRELLF